MYSGQGLVTANSRSAAGSSLKYAAELNIVVVTESMFVVSEFRNKKFDAPASCTDCDCNETC